jgi:nucleolar protein 14
MARRVIFSAIQSAQLRQRPLANLKRKAIPIKTYLPKFQTNYSLDRGNDPNRERVLDQKLKSEYKKEFKGAVRELRKDASFKARQKLKEQKEKDVIYKKKMDKIVGQLAEQEGAMRGFEKEKSKKRKKH